MSKTNLERALVRASQNITAEIRRPDLAAIGHKLKTAVAELNAAHDALARGSEMVLAEAIDTGLREIDAVLAVIERRCD